MESKKLCADMKLKPCPRCGGEYVYVSKGKFTEIIKYDEYCTISCSECGAKVAGAAKYSTDGLEDYSGTALKAAKTVWNDDKRRENYVKNNPLTE